MLPKRSVLDGFVWTLRRAVPPTSPGGAHVSPNNRYANEPALGTLEKNGLTAFGAPANARGDGVPSGRLLVTGGQVPGRCWQLCRSFVSLRDRNRLPGGAREALLVGGRDRLVRLRGRDRVRAPHVGREAHIEDAFANTAGIMIAWWAIALSRSLCPKQFLTEDRTMLQVTEKCLIGLTDNAPLLVCHEEHRFIAGEQMCAIGLTSHILIEHVGETPPLPPF